MRTEKPKMRKATWRTHSNSDEESTETCWSTPDLIALSRAAPSWRYTTPSVTSPKAVLSLTAVIILWIAVRVKPVCRAIVPLQRVGQDGR
jgi:hypothetical protein